MALRSWTVCRSLSPMLRAALCKRAFELRIQHLKQLDAVGKKRSIQIGRMQDERK